MLDKRRHTIQNSAKSLKAKNTASVSNNSPTGLISRIPDSTISEATRKQLSRITWVDIAKALAMIAIIIGHFAPYFTSVVGWAHGLCELMYSFHVALFFILSGYTMKNGIMKPKEIGRLARNCFLPYLVAGIITIAICMIFTPQKSIIEWLAALVYGAGIYKGDLVWGYPFGEYVIGAIWFLPALFIGKIISSVLSKLPILLRILITGALFIIGAGTSGILFLPMDIQQGLCASWYITCGMILSEQKAFSTQGWEKALLGFCATLGIFYMFALTSGYLPEPTYTNSDYHNGAIDMLGTVCASIVVIFIAQLIDQLSNELKLKHFIEWIGKNTLAVFCWHAVSISAGWYLFEWILSFIFVDKCDPTIVFILSTLSGIAVALLVTFITQFIPGLKSVFFPYMTKKKKTE